MHFPPQLILAFAIICATRFPVIRAVSGQRPYVHVKTDAVRLTRQGGLPGTHPGTSCTPSERGFQLDNVRLLSDMVTEMISGHLIEGDLL